MHAFVRHTVMPLAVVLSGCVGNRPLHVAAAPAELPVGDYRLSGSVAGRRIAGAIRFDSTGRAFLVLSSTPAGAFRCESQQWVNDRNLQLSCRTVQLRLAVANRSIAPQATISFDVPTTARREYDPFACQPTAPDYTCGGPSGRETLSVRTKRSTGKVTVQRNAVE